jgi:hypothetical protein
MNEQPGIATLDVLRFRGSPQASFEVSLQSSAA